MTQRLAVFATLAILILGTATLARQGITNEYVLARTTSMTQSKTALAILGNMANGKIPFNRARASDARRDLIKSTRSIPKLFRKPHTDPQSDARPVIWTQWADFEARADNAEAAARAIDTSSLPYMLASLPQVLIACLQCHETYRNGRY